MGVRRSATRQGAINFSASGDNIIVTAPANGPINVYGLVFTVTGATNITFKDASTALTGAMVFTGNGSSMTLPLQDEPWFQIQPGDNFIMNSSNAVTVGGALYYTTG